MKAPAFQFYSADFLIDTQDWSVDEIGIYTRLLANEWVNIDLPVEPERLARIAGCSLKKFQKGWRIIEKKFIPAGEGRLQNRRLEETRQEQIKYVESQRESGKRGAEKRWGKHGDPIGDPNSEQHGEMIALQSSSLKETDTKVSDLLSDHVARNGIPYRGIIDFLNEKAGTKFRHTTKATRRLIHARWNEGFRLSDFLIVIEGRVAKWANDPKMMEFLRPDTLFGPKFEGYLNV